MAKLEVRIEGNSKGLVDAMGQASTSVTNATNKINKGLKVSKAEIEAWDAAARKAANQSTRGIINPRLAENAAASAKALRTANQDLAQSNTKLSSSYGGANMAAIEFSRIIQDAPYGIQGVANNVQQLTQSLAYASKGAGGFGAALKASFSSLISPMNLVVLGISAVTTAWTIYSRNSQKAKKDTDDVKQSFEDYISTLDVVRASLARGEADSQKQLTNLRLLYDATQNATLSLNDRQKAVDALQKQFPSYFGNMKDEAILAGQAKGVYDQLTSSILATAQARASADQITEGAKKQLRNRLEIEQDQELLNIAEQRVSAAKNILEINRQAGLSYVSAEMELQRALKQRDEIGDRINKNASENSEIGEKNSRLASEVTDLIKQGADVTLQFSDNVSSVNKGLKETKTTADKISLSPFEQSLKNSLTDLDKLRSTLNEIYGNNSFDPFDLSGVSGSKGGVTTELSMVSPDNAAIVAQISKDSKEWFKEPKKDASEFSRTMSRAIDRAGRDFYRTMTDLGNMSDATFGGIFATITEGLNSSMQEIFLGQMSDLLKEGIKKGTDGLSGALSSQLNIALAGIGLVGGLISGLGNPNKPNYGAKIGGGALQGAAAGAALGSIVPGIGTVLGAIGGGIVGAIGGLFGGKKREKELKLQEQQLAEQEKQTKLMERQNALQYASSIIGKMVSGVGIVNNIQLNEFGQLTAKVSGQDLQFVLNRANKSSSNGS